MKMLNFLKINPNHFLSVICKYFNEINEMRQKKIHLCVCVCMLPSIGKIRLCWACSTAAFTNATN
jgi:hypothetical protein